MRKDITIVQDTTFLLKLSFGVNCTVRLSKVELRVIRHLETTEGLASLIKLENDS